MLEMRILNRIAHELILFVIWALSISVRSSPPRVEQFLLLRIIHELMEICNLPVNKVPPVDPGSPTP
jgi:hypothetical protein